MLSWHPCNNLQDKYNHSVCLTASVSVSYCFFHLMSWSMLHSGDMSSNVLENFTTYRGDKCHYSQQQQSLASEISEFSREVMQFNGEVKVVKKKLKSRNRCCVKELVIKIKHFLLQQHLYFVHLTGKTQVDFYYEVVTRNAMGFL